jgi:hypothetical protein
VGCAKTGAIFWLGCDSFVPSAGSVPDGSLPAIPRC